MRTLTIVNQKGGCGKTTTAINLSAILARRGHRTLLVDLDPQSHCAAGLGVPEDRIDFGIGDALVAEHGGGFDPAQLIWEVTRNLDLAPSTVMLSALEAPGGGLYERPDRDRRLESLLGLLAPHYDWCVVDCPPNIGLLTFNGLRAATEALIPVETGFFSMRGATRQWKTIQSLIDRIDRPIACHMLATLHDPESRLASNILRSLRREFPAQLLNVVIREHESLREAASLGQPVIEFAPGSDAEGDFEQLAEWLLERPAAPLADVHTVPGVLSGDNEPTDPPRTRAAELARRVQEILRRSADAADERAQVERLAGEVGTDARDPSPATTEGDSAFPTPGTTMPAPQPGTPTVLGATPAAPAVPMPDRSSSAHAMAVFDAVASTQRTMMPADLAATETTAAPESAPPAPTTIMARDAEAVAPTATPKPVTSPAAPAMPAGRDTGDTARAAPTPVTTDAAGAAPDTGVARRPAPTTVMARNAGVAAQAELKTTAPAPSSYGAHPFDGGVRFVQPGQAGQEIAVRADFNGWSTTATMMTFNVTLDAFTVDVPLPPGRYRYQLVVDGQVQADRYNGLQAMLTPVEVPASIVVVDHQQATS